MLSVEELKEYRLREGLSHEDVARYSDLNQKTYSEVETGKLNLTERIYQNYVKGINGCLQAKARGEFDEAKRKALDEKNKKRAELKALREAQKK